MPAIIPIRALTHNCIRILRAPTRSFRRAGEPAVFAAAEVRAGRSVADAVDAVAALRERKNNL